MYYFLRKVFFFIYRLMDYRQVENMLIILFGYFNLYFSNDFRKRNKKERTFKIIFVKGYKYKFIFFYKKFIIWKNQFIIDFKGIVGVGLDKKINNKCKFYDMVFYGRIFVK